MAHHQCNTRVAEQLHTLELRTRRLGNEKDLFSSCSCRNIGGHAPPHHMPRGAGGPRRSKRISAEAKSAPSPPGEHGGDDDDDRTKPQAPKKAARASSRPRRRSARNAAGTAAAEFNLGPDRPPIFLLSQELLKKIWTFLDSKTKMTSTVSDFFGARWWFEWDRGSLSSGRHGSLARAWVAAVRVPAVAALVLGDGGAQPALHQGEEGADRGRRQRGATLIAPLPGFGACR